MVRPFAIKKCHKGRYSMMKITCYAQQLLPGGHQHSRHTHIPSNRHLHSITLHHNKHTNKHWLYIPIPHTSVPSDFASKISIQNSFSIFHPTFGSFHSITNHVAFLYLKLASWCACCMVGWCTPQLIGVCVIGLRHRDGTEFVFHRLDPFHIDEGKGNDVAKTIFNIRTASRNSTVRSTWKGTCLTAWHPGVLKKCGTLRQSSQWRGLWPLGSYKLKEVKDLTDLSS